MWGRLVAIIIKELWAILRDPRARIILIVPPVIQLFVFGFAATLEIKNFDIGIYDRSAGVWSQELAQRLAGSPNVGRILSLHSAPAVQDAIENRRVIAVLSMDEDFNANVAAQRPAIVQAIYDGRRSNASQIVSGYLERIVGEMGASIAMTTPRNSNGHTMEQGSRSALTHWYNPNLDYLWFTMPSLLVVITMIAALAVTAQTVARERELGTFDQLMVSPLRVYEILIGKMVAPLLVGTVNASIFMLIIPNVFGVPLLGSVGLLYLALLLYMCALIGIGMLVSTLSKTQQQAFLGAFLIMVPLILLSGFASPVDNMPHWLQIVAQANPAKHFLTVSQGVFLKDMPPLDVLSNIWPLAVIALATLLASSLMFRSRME